MRRSYLAITCNSAMYIWAAILVSLLSLPLHAANKSAALDDGRGTDLTLITNIENSQNHIVSKRFLKAIFSMRSQNWPNGVPLTTFILADNDRLHERFCIKFLGLLPYQLRRNWERLIYSGRTISPTVVNDLEEMKSMVANTPGAIGYVTQADLDDTIATIEVR